MDLLNLARDISDKDIENLKNYKYTAGEYTKLDNLMNNFWLWAVELLPQTLAPNMVTIYAFISGVLPAVLIVFYDATFQSQYPALLHVLAAVGIFLYQTLDALDGKQARRINAKSPLGQMLTIFGQSFSTAAFWLHWCVFVLKIGDAPVLGLMQALFVFSYYLQTGTIKSDSRKSDRKGELPININWEIVFLGVSHLVCFISPDLLVSVKILDWQARYWVLTMICRHLITKVWNNLPSGETSLVLGKFKTLSKIPYAVIYWLVPLLMFSVQSINTVIPFGLIATSILASWIHLRLQIRLMLSKPTILHPRHMLVLLVVPLLGSFIKQTIEKQVIDGFWMTEVVVVILSYLFQLWKLGFSTNEAS